MRLPLSFSRFYFSALSSLIFSGFWCRHHSCSPRSFHIYFADLLSLVHLRSLSRFASNLVRHCLNLLLIKMLWYLLSRALWFWPCVLIFLCSTWFPCLLSTHLRHQRLNLRLLNLRRCSMLTYWYRFLLHHTYHTRLHILYTVYITTAPFLLEIRQLLNEYYFHMPCEYLPTFQPHLRLT